MRGCEPGGGTIVLVYFFGGHILVSVMRTQVFVIRILFAIGLGYEEDFMVDIHRS